VPTTAKLRTWPADLDHCEAIETLLVMAAAEERWGERGRAAQLLKHAEELVGPLPPEYEQRSLPPA
jgi:hypothetical protein